MCVASNHAISNVCHLLCLLFDDVEIVSIKGRTILSINADIDFNLTYLFSVLDWLLNMEKEEYNSERRKHIRNIVDKLRARSYEIDFGIDFDKVATKKQNTANILWVGSTTIGKLNNPDVWRLIDLLGAARAAHPSVPRRLTFLARMARTAGPEVVGYQNYDAAEDILHAQRLPLSRR